MSILQTPESRDTVRRRPAAIRRSAVLFALVAFTAGAASGETRLEGVADRAFLGLAAATCSVGYAPIKVFIAGSGFIVGGTAWLVTAGRREPALTIWERTGGGDWVVTPEHLTGDREFTMLGRRSDSDGGRRHAALER